MSPLQNPKSKIQNIMLGTAGHVDHGKTALVKMLTGCNTDRLAEEQRRGLTIDLGYAPCRMADDRIVGVVDVPGHVDFIRNMVAGAHGIDVVIFVVAANDGVMPQTREHLDILTLMGVRHGVIALTKCDMVDDDLRALAEEDVREFVRGTFLRDAPICPLSNITGEGYDAFFAALNAAVDACEPRAGGGLFRAWVSDVFTMRGFGAVATGIPSGGAVHVGDRLCVLPGEGTARVRGLEVYGQSAEVGRTGECLALNLADVDGNMVRRGVLLCHGEALHAVMMAEAEIRLLDGVLRPLKDYTEVHLHVGTASTMAKLAVLDDRQIEPGRGHLVQLRLAEPLGLAPGDRFVMRAGVQGHACGRLTTIGGGRVLGVSDIRLRRNRPWTLETLAARRDALDDPQAWCAQALREAGGAVTVAELATRALLPPEECAVTLAALVAHGLALAAGAKFVHRAVEADAASTLVAALTAFHDANPVRQGMDEADLRAAVADGTVCRLALDRLLRDGTVVHRGAVLGLAKRGARITEAEMATLEGLEARFRDAGLEPPPPDNADARLLRLLVDGGALVRLPDGQLMHRDAIARARDVALQLFRQAPAFTTMEFRDALGVSRKYAVPLLDYFDAHKVTVRNGNRRTPGSEAKRELGQAE